MNIFQMLQKFNQWLSAILGKKGEGILFTEYT